MNTQLNTKSEKGGLFIITCGNENWIPTDDEVKAIQDAVILADKSPAGSVLVTREGIEICYLSPTGEKIEPSKIIHVTVMLPDNSLPTDDQLNSIEQAVHSAIDSYYCK